MGAVDKAKVLDKNKMKPGDVIIGLADVHYVLVVGDGAAGGVYEAAQAVGLLATDGINQKFVSNGKSSESSFA